MPANSGMELANWNWKVVCQYVSERFGISLSRSTCLNYLRRLGFSFKRPKKRLLKADVEKREVFVAEYAALSDEARSGHWGQDSSLTRPTFVRTPTAGRCVGAGLGGLEQPALWRKGQLLFVLETGEVGMDGTEQQLRNIVSLPGTVAGEAQRSSEPDWDNAPAHRGEAVREYLRTPGLNLRLFNLPGYRLQCR